MRRTCRLLVLGLLSLVAAGVLPAARAMTFTGRTLARPEGARHYIVVDPGAGAGNPALRSLVILLHGHGESAATMVGRTVWGADPAGIQVEFLRIGGGAHIHASRDEALPWLLGKILGPMNHDVTTSRRRTRHGAFSRTSALTSTGRGFNFLLSLDASIRRINRIDHYNDVNNGEA